MTVWVMIMMMGSYRGTIATHEFLTKERCEAAVVQFVAVADAYDARAICVQK